MTSVEGRRVDPAGVIVAAILAALAGVIVWDMSRLQISSVYGLGPKAMPIVVAAGLAALAVGNLAIGLRGGLPHRERLDARPLLLILGGLAALIGLVALGGGFIPAIAILFWSTSAALRRRVLVSDLGIGFGFAAACYLFFVRLLGLSLPAGPLERLI